ncbi:MAG TPA: hypothetical protein V6C85_11800 [Allocoleopsis sp.]
MNSKTLESLAHVFVRFLIRGLWYDRCLRQCQRRSHSRILLKVST